MPKTRRNNQDGFSLLETLVALTIASLGLVMIIQTFANGFRASSRVESQYALVRTAQSIMNEKSIDLTPIPEDETGDINNITWQVEYRLNDKGDNNETIWVHVKTSSSNGQTFKLKRLFILESEDAP